MTLSSDGLYAKHVAPFEDDMFGGVLGDLSTNRTKSPLP